ncbi:MAG: hypothetical protein GY913_10650 [Proteobacteria bacterium]|nr:hypothetical protein [Pseudomonadota bacterium]MCP4917372.1 hypothetical protein [Pseudomonadota bacterium]
MAFRYTSLPLTQGISSLLLIGGFFALTALPGAQAAWTAWIEATPPLVHLVGAVLVLHAVVFWGMSAAFKWVDVHDSPAFIARYRIQSGPPREPPRARVVKNLLLNQLVVTPIMLVGLWGDLELRGWSVDPVFPGIVEVLVDLAGLGVVATIYLYAIVGTHTFVAHHSGYAVPWLSWSVHHDWHHYKYNEAFGTYGVLDRILGTDEAFRALEDGEDVR